MDAWLLRAPCSLAVGSDLTPSRLPRAGLWLDNIIARRVFLPLSGISLCYCCPRRFILGATPVGGCLHIYLLCTRDNYRLSRVNSPGQACCVALRTAIAKLSNVRVRAARYVYMLLKSC